MSSSKTLDFITKAKSIHGEKYDYSNVIYLYASGNVLIICSEHGGFWQRPNSHLSGRGCPTCAEISRRIKNSSNKDEFIPRAKKVHGDLYDYSDAKYVNSKTKISIKCKKHGLFKQLPLNHLNGSGCSLCAIDKRSNTQKDFLSKARKTHGDRYDYSKVIYTGLNRKVLIICRVHGDFWQTGKTHLNGCGCKECARKKRSRKVFLSTEQFIERAKKVHEDLYDYSDVRYVKSATKVRIKCKKHGVFEQSANSHLSGHGCKECGRKKVRR